MRPITPSALTCWPYLGRLAVAAPFLAAAFCPAGLAAGTPAQADVLDRLKSEATQAIAPLTSKTDDRLKQVTTFDHQVTGVTVTKTGRIFVNFPRWTEDVPISVAEVMQDGSIRPYPNDEWNAWRNSKMGKISPKDHFVTVQSVVADRRGSLWVVDPAAPNAEKTVKDGPKLVQIDLASNSVKRIYPFGPEVAGPASYLNDVRIAPDGRFAYLTDSGSPGGLVVVDLGSGKAWRVLSSDASTQADPTVVVKTDGKPLNRPDGRQPMFNADGIALSPNGRVLYWQALTGKTLYKIGTDVLQQAGSNPQAISAKATKVAETEPADGLWISANGTLYLSALGENAVKRLQPNGTLKMVIQDPRLRWPDTFSQGPDGEIYITTSHIQDSPWFHTGGWTDKSFALFKFAPPQQDAVKGPD